MTTQFPTLINSNLPVSYFQFPQNEPTVNPRTENSIQNDEPMWSTEDQVFGDQPMYIEDHKLKNYARTALNGIQIVSPFSKLFFSSQNIAEIQNLIRYNCYVNTDNNYIIGEQDVTQLVILMRGVYLQYARVPSNKKDYTAEIEKLNSIVVSTALPNLISEIEQFYAYMKDTSQNMIPISSSINTSIKGERILRSQTDVFVGDEAFFA